MENILAKVVARKMYRKIGSKKGVKQKEGNKEQMQNHCGKILPILQVEAITSICHPSVVCTIKIYIMLCRTLCEKMTVSRCAHVCVCV